MADITLEEIRKHKRAMEEEISNRITTFAKDHQVQVEEIVYDIIDYQGIHSPPWSSIRVEVKVKL